MRIGKIGLLILTVYIASRMVGLTKLPVFADEAIYIRWAQMIHDDPKQFAFLPLYDGKSPLYIWMLIPFVNYIQVDPLLVARTFSVLSALLLMLAIRLIVKESGGDTRAQILACVLVIILPFTFFYSRMALIDTLLSAWLGLSFWSFLRGRNRGYDTKLIALSGLFWGFGLMTKTSAFYFLPVIAGIYVYDFLTNKKVRNLKKLLSMLAALFIGLTLLGWMRISPLFPFLFQRSSDFAYSPVEIVNNFPNILTLNIYRIGKWLWFYMTPIMIVPVLWWIKQLGKARTLNLFLAASAMFIFPFLVSGKLLSSRYFLPVVIWLIPLLSLALIQIWRYQRWLAAGIMVVTIIFSLRFIWPLWTNPGQTPFPNEDVVQYLTEWSAGYGIPEVRDYLIQRAKDHKVYVATEGYFGTLPDGLYIYFNRSPLQKNLEIHGIGQPISDIPQDLLARADTEEVYLVVNSHRFTMKFDDPRIILIGSYPRPRKGPSLLLFRIKP